VSIQVLQKEPIIKKLEDISTLIVNLRQEITVDVESKLLIKDAATVRSCLDELEKMIFEEYSRECFLSILNNNQDEVDKWLMVLNRLYK
jgi:hypothetical protein